MTASAPPALRTAVLAVGAWATTEVTSNRKQKWFQGFATLRGCSLPSLPSLPVLQCQIQEGGRSKRRPVMLRHCSSLLTEQTTQNTGARVGSLPYRGVLRDRIPTCIVHSAENVHLTRRCESFRDGFLRFTSPGMVFYAKPRPRKTPFRGGLKEALLDSATAILWPRR